MHSRPTFANLLKQLLPGVILVHLLFFCGKEPQEVSPAALPTVVTGSASGISTDKASVSGKIEAIGSSPVTQHGHCWLIGSGTPTITDTKTAKGNGDAGLLFTSELPGLSPNTTYSVRAYAVNSAGTSYGTIISFKTDSPPVTTVKPAVETTEVTDIATTNAVGKGRILNDGTPVLTEYGLCWAIGDGLPTISNTKIIATNRDANGRFFATMSPLVAGTQYSVRAYATNSNGTEYGEKRTFNTGSLPVATLPTVELTDVTDIQQTTAVGKGRIVANGSSDVTEYGICWKVGNVNPTISDSKKTTSNRDANGNFSGTIDNLTANTLYSVRAFATNASGTGYGQTKQITSASAVACTVTPTVSTTTASNITQTTAVVGGKIDNEGGGTCQVSEYGHIWTVSTNADPTVPVNGGKTTKTAAISSGGTFSSDVTGLTAGTTYKVRAYAKNQTNVVVYGAVINVTASQVRSIKITNNSSLPITRIDVVEGGNTRQLSLPGGQVSLGASHTFSVSAAQVGLTINSTRDGCGVSQTATVSVGSGQTTNISLTNPTAAQVMTGFKPSGFSTFTSVNVRPGGAYTISYYFYTDGRFAWEDSNNGRGNGTFTLLSWPANSTAITIRTTTSGDFVVPCPYRAFSSNGFSFTFER